jgi:hypothetical protein
MMRRVAKPVVFLMILSFLSLDFTLQRAHAAMVATESVLAAAPDQSPRGRLERFLDRQDVQAAFVNEGIDPAEVRARVNSLSEAEVSRAAQVLDQLPAGGGAVGAIVGAALLVFIVLLVTDILGFTDVFSFVNHPRR